MDTINFRILGPIDALSNGDAIQLGGAKSKTVLAALLMAEGQVVTVSRLGYLLWRDRPPKTCDAQVYTYISRLRKSLDCQVSISRRGHGYAMSIGDASCDWKDFERLSRMGRDALAERRFRLAAKYLSNALSLFRGNALADGTEHLISEEAASFEEARMAAREGRIEAYLALGVHTDLVPELLKMVTRYPFHERVRAQLMLALHRCGRQSEAIAVYHEGRRLLAEELGVDPSQVLADVFQGILTGRPELQPAV
ncbi:MULTISPECIES: AfsR/SARP family transcriptional regulator [Streptomyces]|uniref:AfsR/SARP family transcriptional regulator n=1 Tax=Streptomyces TaxID=1883 RepID=UPI001E4B1B71|nr:MULTISPECIES: AfsR/SARP family transcriptional regulator [Streptomyces]UFQ18556.1 AfsR/SARP family transcriptional regulator [Streptomyces huasconensis]WCL88171.1 AfsR/SARP family transcriptional regulator [Streptomyces sp. JCM 35825]